MCGLRIIKRIGVSVRSLGAPAVAEFFESDRVQLVLVITLVAMLSATGRYLVSKLRGGSDEDQPITSDMLTNMQKMHQKGDLSEEEFRTIKTHLAARLKDELKDDKQQG